MYFKGRIIFILSLFYLYFIFLFYFLLVKILSGDEHVHKFQEQIQDVCSKEQNPKMYSEQIMKKALKLKNKMMKDLCLSHEDFVAIISEVE